MSVKSAARAKPAFVLRTAAVRAIERVSPSFARVTFAGPGLEGFGNLGDVFDTRIKIVFPPESGVLPNIDEESDDWWAAYLAVPEDERGSMRTYSIRELRVDGADTEVVVDFVLHLEPGLTGPASLWASTANVGDEVFLVGPRRGSTERAGIEYAPGEATTVLLAGDETAAPAIARILEDAPRDLRGIAFIEVPEVADELLIAAPSGVEVRWLVRGAQAHGTLLLPEVLGHLGDEQRDQIVVEDLADEQLVWETPVYSGLGEDIAPATAAVQRYHWIAGESGVVTTLRRHLVRDLGIDRTQVAFMGYWRRGVAMRG